MNADSNSIKAIALMLERFDELMLDEGLTVTGGFETDAQRIYFAADEGGTHRITGAGPK